MRLRSRLARRAARLCGAAALSLLVPTADTAAQRAPARSATDAASPRQALDPAVRTGRLANGLTYYVRRNAEPRARAEMYLVVNAGSVLEDADQRGLAHVLEHMLFNGTARFPKNDLVRYLESTGMRFGGDVNAYTSFDETVYTLTVPTDSARIYDRAFDVLRDWAGAATLDPEEVRRERGVVMEEWRLSDQNAGGRIRSQLIPALLPGSRYAQRLPIGDTTILRHAEAPALRRFYRDWYRPDLMAVVVVGDVDVAATEARLRQTFADLRGPASPRPRPTLPAPRASTVPRYLAVTDAEFPQTLVQIQTTRPATPSRTEADGRDDLVTALVAGMLNQRFEEVARQQDAPFLGAGLSVGSLVRPAESVTLGAAFDPDRVEAGYTALLREAERARRFGFTAGELARTKAEVLRRYETAYRERERTPSAEIARGLVQHFLTGAVQQSAEADLRLVERLLPGVGLADVNAAAARMLAPTGRAVVFVGTDRPGKTELTTATLGALDRRARAALGRERLTPYVDRAVDSTLMAAVPTPVAPASTQAYDAFGATALTFPNGLRVVVKPTAFKADEVRFTLTKPGGSSRVADADEYAASVAAQVAVQSGVGTFDRGALDRFLAGKQVMVMPYVGATDVGFNGSASPQDLERAFQLLNRYVAAPRFDPAALSALQAQTRAFLANVGATPQGALQDTLGRVVFQPSPRVRTAAQTLAALDALTLAQVERVYRDRFADLSGATLTLVGAVDVPTVQRLAATYLGSLPARRPAETFDASVLPVRRAEDADVTVYKGTGQQAQVVLLYQTTAEAPIETRQRLNLLASILSARLLESVRENLSGVYGIQAQGSVSNRPRPEAQVLVAFGCDPARVDELTAAVRTEIAKVMAEGPTEAQLRTGQEQQRRARQTGLEQNAYWVSTLDRAFAWPDGRPDEVVNVYERLVDASTVANVKADAERFLGPGVRKVRLVLLPESMRPAGR